MAPVDRRVAIRDRFGEDRQLFKQAMLQAGWACPRAIPSPAWSRRWRWRRGSATRCWCGPSFTLGGSGGGIAYDQAELRDRASRGLDARQCARC